MQITSLAGGVGGAMYLEGLRYALTQSANLDLQKANLTAIVNTGDDITLHGLRVCPDLDTLMYRLGGGIDSKQGWGRAGETHGVSAELNKYGEEPSWFSLGDRDIATHLIRTRLLNLGYPLHRVTEALCARWGLGPDSAVTLLPMSDQSVETHVVVADRDIPQVESPDAEAPLVTAKSSEATRAIHFQEWWVRYRARIPAQRILAIGAENSRPAPGVLEAIQEADIILLSPSNPVVSIGMILTIPGIREALRNATAPVVGVSPIIADAPVRGMADACLRAIGVPTTAASVADLYADFLDGWLVDTADKDIELKRSAAKIVSRNLYMQDVELTADIATASLQLAQEISATGRRR